MNAIDWLARQELYNPEKTAVIDLAAERSFTYRELNAQANRMRRFLESRGIRAGDRVCVLLPSGAGLLLVLFGATKLGAIFVPLNFKLSAPELIRIAADAAPSILIYGCEFEELAASIAGVERFRFDDIDARAEPGEMRV